MASGDEALRPLSAPGRWQRLTPFAIVAVLANVVGLMPPRVDTGALLVASGATVAVVAAVPLVPWERLPAWCEALPALAYFAIIIVLRNGGGGVESGYAPLMLIPLMWLALFHSRTMLVVGVGVALVSYAIGVRLGSGAATYNGRQFVLIVSTVAVLSFAVQQRVFFKRRAAAEQREVAEAMRKAYERERAAAERLRELDEVRSDLVATVSHELRTPLTSILGNVELLVDGEAGALNRPQARLLAAVERNARRLLTLIEDLLMLSRIESGAMKVNARPVLVRPVVNGALEALAAVRGQRGVELTVELPNEPIVVYGDRAQLERVTINLLDNALKFTPAGGQARLCVSVTPTFVQLTISDTGMGIPADEMDQIFDRFFRSTRSRERASQGSGLGLAITKSIVERHGGRILVASNVGTGTEVTCLLPRAAR